MVFDIPGIRLRMRIRRYLSSQLVFSTREIHNSLAALSAMYVNA